MERGFSGRATRAAIARLEEAGWLDDLAAARSAVRSRGGRYGSSRIERELARRGFARETIEAALREEGSGGQEEEALTRAFRRFWDARAGLPPETRRRRVFDALLRRGFPAERISEIIRKGP